MTQQRTIIQFLKDKDWIAGGIIEDFMRDNHAKHPKGSTTSRNLRVLEENGIIEKKYVGRPVFYRYLIPKPKTEEDKKEEELKMLIEAMK